MLFERPTYSPEDEPTFQRMQKELEQYNDSLASANPLPKPSYDPKVFRQFRQWQADQMRKKLDEYDAKKKASS